MLSVKIVITYHIHTIFRETDTAQLTQEEKVYVDDLAMQRVDDMNSDEFLVRQLDDKIHGLASHLKAYFEERLAFHKQNKN